MIYTKNYIILEDWEKKAIRMYILGVWEIKDAQSIISETILLYYKKRMKLKFKTYDDTLKWLKVASKFGKMKSDELLNDSAPNRINAKKRYIREFIWEEENNKND